MDGREAARLCLRDEAHLGKDGRTMDMHHSIIQQSINPLIQSPTPSILASFPGRRLDQFPELRILLQRFVLLHLESRAEEKIFERVPAENAMHHQAQLVALK